ncbi:hypothetical protein Avbf_17668 [Armadillidium vulgare]|nr:hypothetical protein Avbf_17668 [Armadillidium vulgare]
MHSIYKCMSHEHIYRDAPPLTYFLHHQRKEEKFLEVEKEKVNLIKSNLKRQSEEEIGKLKILREKSSSHKLLISLIQNQNKKLDMLEILLKSLDGRLKTSKITIYIYSI